MAYSETTPLSKYPGGGAKVVMYYTPGHFFEKSATGVYYITTRHLMEKYVLETILWKIYFGNNTLDQFAFLHIVLPYGV